VESRTPETALNVGPSNISQNGKSVALDIMERNCRLNRAVSKFYLVTLEKNESNENWFIKFDTVYNLKFRIEYENTWHRDWIQVTVMEPYDARFDQSSALLGSRVVKLESSSSICQPVNEEIRTDSM
jgi:hypothetical protein